MSKECKEFLRSNYIYTVSSGEESACNYSDEESPYRYSEDEGDLEADQGNETVGVLPTEIQPETTLSKTPSDLDISQLVEEDTGTDASIYNATAPVSKPTQPDKQHLLDNPRENYIKPELRKSPEEIFMQQKIHQDNIIGVFKSTILVHNLFAEFEELKWDHDPIIYGLNLWKQTVALKVVDQDQLDRTILKHVWKSTDWTKTGQIPDVQPEEEDLIMSFTERMASFEYGLISKILMQMAFPNCYKGIDCYKRPLSDKDALNGSQGWYDPDSFWLKDKKVTFDKVEKLVSWYSNPNTLQTKIYYAEIELKRVRSLLIYFRRAHDYYSRRIDELKEKNEPWSKDQKEWVNPISAAVAEKSHEEKTNIEIVKTAKLFKAIKEVLLQKQCMFIK